MTDDTSRLDIATFLAASIHDMKNSLGVMASYLESALGQAGSDHGPVRREAARALYETQRMNDNLLQLLALYKIDRNFYPYDPQEQHLRTFGQELLERVAQIAGQRGLGMRLECADDLHWWFDHELVFSAVLQALHNAQLYTRDRIQLSFAVRDGLLHIRVEDDGPGYPPALLEQGDAIGRGICFETGSTGLGLYFSGVVARLHRNRGRQGETRLENRGQLGGGAFVLSLP